MTTIELTEDHIENLTAGAQQYGRCSLLVETDGGEPVFVVVTSNHRRGRPRRRGEPGPAPQTSGAAIEK